MLDHLPSDIELGHHAVAQRAHRRHVPRAPANHLPCFFTHRHHATRPGIDRDYGRLVEDDALALPVDQRVRRAEVDRDVAAH